MIEIAAALGESVQALPLPNNLPEKEADRKKFMEVQTKLAEVQETLKKIDWTYVKELQQMREAMAARAAIEVPTPTNPTEPRAAVAKISTSRSAHLRDYLRDRIHIPQDGPVLVIGMPEGLLGYEPWGSNEEPSDFRRLLDEAGYPNRFSVQRLNTVTHSKEEVKWPHLSDRKTLRQYKVRLFDPAEGAATFKTDDVGFLFFGRTRNGRPLLVAAGSSDFGTYAAVRLLVHGHHLIDEAMAECARDGSKVLDVGFRCEYRSLDAKKRPFPHVYPVDHLLIDVLNAGDLLGYSWGKDAEKQLGPLFNAAQANQQVTLGDNNLQWSSDPSDDKELDSNKTLKRVQIKAEVAYCVSQDQVVFPGEKLEKVYAQAYKDLVEDRDQWRQRLGTWQPSIMRTMSTNQDLASFQPIMLLGPTGAGKQIFALFIARWWGGQTLNPDSDTSKPNEYFPRIAKSLEVALNTWLVAKTPPGSDCPISPMKQVFVPEFNRNTLEAELFGAARGAFTGCDRNRAGAFLSAGTGVLFLDEFLELPAEEQTRFLGALGTNRVQPTGYNEPQCYVCRVIAATNKAVTQEELDDFVDRGLIRRDIMARFSRTYELSPLSERVFEVIPLLMSLLGRRHKMRPDDMQFRISAPALKVVATHALSANVRALDALATRVPKTVVNSGKDAPPVPVGDTPWFLGLSHLGSLGVRECDNEHEFTPLEDVIFQFTLSSNRTLDPANFVEAEDYIPNTPYFDFLREEGIPKLTAEMADVVKTRINDAAVALISTLRGTEDFIDSLFGESLGSLRVPLLKFYIKLVDLRGKTNLRPEAFANAIKKDLSKSNSLLAGMPFYGKFGSDSAVYKCVLAHLKDAVSTVENKKDDAYLYSATKTGDPGHPPSPIDAELLLDILTGQLSKDRAK